jgi:hypothetical protein
MLGILSLLSGGEARAQSTLVTISANTTLTSCASPVLVNRSSSQVVVTLPSAVGIGGQTCTILSGSALAGTTGNVAVQAQASQNINGINPPCAASQQTTPITCPLVLNNQYEYVILQSDGANWTIVSNPAITNTGTVLACPNQGALAAVTGLGATTPIPFVSCTIPAGMMKAGGCVQVDMLSVHTTGNANNTIGLTFGGIATAGTSGTITGNANQRERVSALICNAVGSTTSQIIMSAYTDSNAGNNVTRFDTASINTNLPVVVGAQIQVANTDAVTSELFVVRTVQ